MAHIIRANGNDPDFFYMPDGTRRYVGVPQNQISISHTDHPINNAINEQFHLNRNERTGHIVMPLLGSGFDDWFNRAVATGTMQGTGLTPVVDGELSNVIRRLQMLVHDWVISYKSPFRSPILKTANLFAQAEDGMGIKKFLSYMTGSLLSMNSGFIYSTLPLHMPIDNWREFGARLRPLRDSDGQESGEFYLTVPPRRFAQNKGMWALDNLQCDPTGNPEWPMRIMKDGTWILCHKTHVNQILGELGGKAYDLAGWWPCPLYIYFGEMGVMNSLVVEYNFEGFFNAPPEGMVVLVNADTSDQLSNIVETHLKQREENNSLYFPGTMWVSIQNKDGNVFFVPFKRPSEGFSQEEFVRLKQRRLALAFGLSLNFVTLEIGVGAVHQAAVADMLGEITGISWIKNKAQHLFNHLLSPPRVEVMVSIPSSAAKQQQADVFGKVVSGVKTLQDAGANLSENQILRLVEKMTGSTIPEDTGSRSIDENQTGADFNDPVIEEDDNG